MDAKKKDKITTIVLEKLALDREVDSEILYTKFWTKRDSSQILLKNKKSLAFKVNFFLIFVKFPKLRRSYRVKG